MIEGTRTGTIFKPLWYHPACLSLIFVFNCEREGASQVTPYTPILLQETLLLPVLTTWNACSHLTPQIPLSCMVFYGLFRECPSLAR